MEEVRKGGDERGRAAEINNFVNPNLMTSYLGASTLSHHFANHCISFSNSREVRRLIKENLDVEIIWKGNIVKTLKKVGLNHASYA